MSDKVLRRSKPCTKGADVAGNGEGHWGLDLWSGCAWFTEWFYERLQWPAGAQRRQLDDLRPVLPAEDWESLLRAIRDHLECCAPLDLQLRVELADGRSESWHLQGMAERNAWGQPVQVHGSVREVSTALGGGP